MVKFILKLLLFLSPLSLFFLLPLFVYWEGGEFTSVQDIIAAQEGNREVLFGAAYTSPTHAYKYDLIAERDPQLLILGTSRTLGFHSSFFSPGITVINAGNAIENVAGFASLMQSLPANQNSKVLIVGLDPWLFKENTLIPFDPGLTTTAVKLQALFTGEWRTVWLDYLSGKFSLSGLIHAHQTSPYIGVSALIQHDGFLNDGSRIEESTIHNASRLQNNEVQISDDEAQIKGGNIYFEFGTAVASSTVDSIKSLLQLCRQRNIYCIGYIPPYPHGVYEAYASNEDPYVQTVEELPGVLQETFAQYNYPLFDYMDATSVGIPDSEFIDDVHPTDKADLRILIDMAEHNSTLAQYVSLPNLRALLKNTPGDFVMTSIP